MPERTGQDKATIAGHPYGYAARKTLTYSYGLIPAILAVLISLLAAACTTQATAPNPTPDPRIDELEQRLATISALAGDTPTPEATPTPGLSSDQIKALIDSKIGPAIAAIPTPTPQPTHTPQATPTPGLSLDEIEALIDSKIEPAIAAIPTATPQPTPTPVSLPALVAIIPQASGPAFASVDTNVTLKVEPGRPLAGRNVNFTLEGLDPWEQVTIEFVDPLGMKAEWIVDDWEAHFTRSNGVPVTQRILYADESGHAEWTRIGTLDVEGLWSMRITIDGKTNTATYPVTQLQLSVQQLDRIGIQLHQYQGFVSQTYYSAIVPATLAVDLQAHLAWVVDQLRDEQGIQSSQIPDIYLAGNEDLFKQLSRAIGIEVGFEAGFYYTGSPRPGIYMRTDFFRTSIRRLLTHEYVHLVLGELAGSKTIPAWLNEGLAEYYELQLGIRGEQPDVSRRQLYFSVDRAKQAAASASLIPLTSLESQAVWNSQTDDDRIRLQYAEAHMAVRYLIETYGINGPIDMVRNIENGASLATAITSATDLTYEEFQQEFVSWLSIWEDPQRDKTRQYIDAINAIMASQELILDQRALDLASQAPFAQRVPVKQAMVSDAQGLQSTALTLTAPTHLSELHKSLLTYLAGLTDWLSLELEYVQTQVDLRRVEANDMIPEMDALSIAVLRGINSVEFNYQLDK